MKKALCLAALFGCVAIFSVGCKRSPESMADKITSKVSSKLDLNEAQEAKLDKIKVAMLAEYQEKQAKKDDRKELFQKFVMSERLNKDEIKSLMNERMDTFEEKFEKHFPLFEDFHASLNAEQKQKLIELSEKFHKRSKKWH